MARRRDYDTVTEPRPRADAYTGMLLLSLLILVGGCVLLFLDYQQYDYGKQPPRYQSFTPPAASGDQQPPVNPDGGGAPNVPPGGNAPPQPGG